MNNSKKTKAQLIAEVEELQGGGLRTILETIPHGVVETDRKGKVTYGNSACHKLFGVAEGELTGAAIFDRLESRAERQSLRRCLVHLVSEQPEPSPYHTTTRTKDGRSLELRVDWNYKRDHGGKLTGFVAALTDITEQKRNEEELRASRTLLQTVVDTFPHNLAVRDREGRMLLVNNTWERFFGCSREDAVGKRLTEVPTIKQEHALMALKDDQDVLSGREKLSVVEQPRIDSQENDRLLQFVKAPLLDENEDIVGVVAVATDITEQKRDEEELRAGRTLLQTMFDTMPVGVYVKDRERRYVMYNRAHARRYGVDSEAIKGRTAEEVSQWARSEVQLALEEDRQVLEEGKFIDIPERSIVRPDGSVQWHRIFRAPLHNEDGDITGLMAIREDITDRKQAEEELRASQGLLQTVFDTMPVGMFVKDADGKFLMVNDTFCEYFGLTPDEFLALPPEKMLASTEDERAQTRSEDEKVIKTGRRLDIPEKATTYAGKTIWWHVTKSPLRDNSGKVVGIVGSRLDITERKQAEEELRESEERFRAIFDNSPSMIALRNLDGRYSLVNRRFLEWFGVSEAEVVNKTIHDIFPEEYADRYTSHDQEVLKSGTVIEREIEVPFPDGTPRTIISTKFPVMGPNRQIIAVGGIALDITERKQAEEELRASQRLLQTVFDSIPHWIYVKGSDDRFLLANRAMASDIETDEQDIVGMHTLQLKTGSEEDRKEFLASDRQVFETGERVDVPPYTMTLTSGEQSIRQAFKLPLQDDEGNIIGLVGFSEDITERKQAEEELRASQRLLQTVFDTIPHTLFIRDVNSKFLMANRALTTRYNAKPEDFIGRHILDIPVGTEEERGGILEIDRELLKGEQSFVNREVSVTQPSGEIRIFNTSMLPLRDDDDATEGLVGIAEDITERKQAEEELRASQRLLQTVFDTIPIGVFVKDAQGVFQMVNRAFCEHRDLSPEEFLSLPGREMFVGTDEEKDRTRREDRQVMESGARLEIFEKPDTLGDKEYCWHVLKSPLLDESGKAVGVVGVREDVTGRKQAEERLRQAQKMEAVGQLAGGVAHEFNNLLHMIMGFTEIALESTPAGDSRHNNLTTIQQATERGAALVRQLLGYSRRQILRPSVLDVNELMSSLSNMVTATIGRRIPVVFNPGRDIKPIYADAGSIEQVLLNLAINARDAMPSGGSLTLETRNENIDEEFCAKHAEASPGDYVRISVSDTGEGMNEDLLEHIFEPFFTTKGPQEGSGLGLAMVQGLVNQHGGLVDVSSQPGKGTTFDLYLPVHGNGAMNGAPDAGGRAGGNTILVAEDERDVQELSAALLEREGYTVLRASDGQEAKEVFERNAAEIDLVLLDMVMPKADGREVYEHIRKLRPEVPVIFHSAYDLGKSDSDFLARQKLRLLRKPYTSHQLRNAVNELLKFSKLS